MTSGPAGSPAEPSLPSDFVSLFFALFDQSSDAVWITRAEDGLLYDANASFLSLFGFAREHAIGRTTVDLGLWTDPADRTTLARMAVENGRIDRYLVRVRTRWAEEFTLSVSEIEVEWRGGRALLGVGRPVEAWRPSR